MKDERFKTVKMDQRGKTPDRQKKKKSHRGHGCLCCVVKRRLWTVSDMKGRKMTNTEQKWIKGENPGFSKKKKNRTGVMDVCLL
jgi:hypothetical protein